MLRVHQSESAEAAKDYYRESLDKEHYYSEKQQSLGRWHGEGARLLGLEGEIQKKDFEALIYNKNPLDGERLTGRDNPNRTVGYDFTFSAPKSVTLLYEMTGDEKVLELHKQAVQDTMKEIEADMAVRVRAGGKDEDRVTGNLVYGEFTHFTARPVEGVTDPHLHTHCYVFNASYDAVEDKWKAGQFRELKRDAPYYEAAYDARLAKGLQDMGREVEKRMWGKKLGWEIKDIKRDTIDKFSQRTGEIEAEARKRGITDDKEKDGLGARTRKGKNKHVSREDLRAEWQGRLTADERRVFAALQKGTSSHKLEPSKQPESKKHDQKSVTQATKHALNFAVEHQFQNHSAVSEKRLLETALREGVGKVTPEGVGKELRDRDDLYRRNWQGRKFVTSKEVLQEEKAMFNFVRNSRGVHKALGRTDRRIERDFLNDQQKQAIRSVWASADKVTAIRGAAGVGKTTLMQEAVAGIEANGRKVFTFAPSSQASRGVLREKGFEGAETVQRLLDSKKMQEQVKGGVLWIDEAGLLSSKDMRAVLRVAEQQEARVVLSGDTKQHHSVGRGDAFRLLKQEAGLAIAEVREIVRQRGRYKQLVKELSKGNTNKAFKILEDMGSIQEIKDRDERSNMLLRSYEGAVKAREDVLIVSPTHKEGRGLLSKLRASQRQLGLLRGQDREFMVQRDLNLSEAEKKQTVHYQKGRVVQFSKHTKGFKAGEKLPVSGVDAQGRVWVEKDGQNQQLNLHERYKFQVYETEKLPVAKGERIRVTKNGFSIPNLVGKRHRFNNGTLHTVTGFTKQGDLKLKNGWVMSKDYANFTQGNITTSHAAQGKDVSRVLIMQSASSLRASSREQFYVSVSRGKKQVEVFTDNKQALKRAVTDSGERPSGTEVMRGPEQSRASLNIRLRETAKAYASYFRDASSHFREKVSAAKENWQDKIPDKGREIGSHLQDRIDQARQNWRDKLPNRRDDLVPER